MLEGKVTKDREPLLDIKVLDRSDQASWFRAIVDSGYNGHLTLPTSAIRELELPLIGEATVELANGDEISCLVYRVRVSWDGKILIVPVSAADAHPLIGMALMDGYELRIQVRRGGKVVLEAMT